MTDTHADFFENQEPAPADFNPDDQHRVFVVTAVYNEGFSDASEAHYGYYHADSAEDLHKVFKPTSDVIWNIGPVTEAIKSFPSEPVKPPSLRTLVQFAKHKRIRYS